MLSTQARGLSAQRLGTLLASSRTAAGHRIDELVARCNGVFAADELQAFEDGRAPVDEAVTSTLLDLYEVDHSVAASGEQLVIDLIDDEVRIGAWSRSIESPTVDEVLDQYLRLVNQVRSYDQVGPFRLRGEDLDVLGEALVLRPDDVRARLVVRMQVRPRRAAAFLGPALAGALVIVVVVSAFVLTRQAPDDSALAVSAASLEAAGDSSETAFAAVAAAAPARSRAPVLDARSASIEASLPWDFRAALADWTIKYDGPHDDWRGVTNSVRKSVTVFDRPGDSVDVAAWVLAHELGHAVDLEHLDDTKRGEWMELRGITGAWWASDGQADFAVGSGDFAEAVAALLLQDSAAEASAAEDSAAEASAAEDSVMGGRALGGSGRSPHGPYTPEQLAFVDHVLPRP